MSKMVYMVANDGRLLSYEDVTESMEGYTPMKGCDLLIKDAAGVVYSGKRSNYSDTKDEALSKRFASAICDLESARVRFEWLKGVAEKVRSQMASVPSPAVLQKFGEIPSPELIEAMWEKVGDAYQAGFEAGMAESEGRVPSGGNPEPPLLKPEYAVPAPPSRRRASDETLEICHANNERLERMVRELEGRLEATAKNYRDEKSDIIKNIKRWFLDLSRRYLIFETMRCAYTNAFLICRRIYRRVRNWFMHNMLTVRHWYRS